MNAPKLAPPGAGIPFFERMLGRYVLLPRETKARTWNDNLKRFGKETARIEALASSLTPEQGNTKVLVPRAAGLEDSSRFWSVGMALEHLEIVATSMQQAVTQLAQGQVPQREVNTAQVKPKNTPSFEAVRARFPNAMESIRTALADEKIAQPGFASRLRFKHPWFGLLTAHQWVWLLGQHQALHRKQVQEILARLQA